MTREDWLWKTLSEMYPGLWVAQAGRTPTDAWRVGLAALSSEDWRRGARKLTQEWTSRHPPSLPEFRALCSDGRTPEQRARDARIAREQPELARLPRQGETESATLLGALAVLAALPDRWHALRVLDGHALMPPGWTMDTVADALEGQDVQAMRAAIARHRQEEATRRGMPESELPGASPGPWAREGAA